MVRDTERDWLNLGAASRLLGVNESTLRRWADAGLVETFRTPGGHRRFSLRDLRRLIRSDGSALGELDREALQQIRERLEHRAEAPPAWLQRTTPDHRQAFGELGRRMLTLVSRYLAADDNGAALQPEIGTLGAEYARISQTAGLSLAEAVSAFAYFRRGMDEAVRRHARDHGLSADAAGGVWEQVSALEDWVLVAFTSAFEQSGVAESAPAGGRAPRGG